MVEIVRTKSTNIDFRVLVTILNGSSKVDPVSIQSVFLVFNSIDFTDTAVVAYVNNLPVGCGCFIKIDEENVEFKYVLTKFEYKEKGIKELIVEELTKWAKELGFHKIMSDTGIQQPMNIF
jgi:putative acetyltransferase